MTTHGITSRLIKLIQLAGCLAAFSGSAWALDVVVLKSGGEIRGEIISKADGKLLVDLLPGEISLPAENVKEIRQQENPEWYVDRIRGRDPITAVEILDSCLRAGCPSKSIHDKYVELCASAAENLMAQGLPARAAEICRRALALRPDNANVVKLLRKVEAAERRTAAEMRALQAEVEKRPDNDYARFMLAEAYRRLGRPQDAFAEYRKITDGKVRFEGGVERLEDLRAFIGANLQVEDAAVEDPGIEPPPGKMLKAKLPGFDVYFHDPDLGRELTGKLPAISKRVAADLGCEAASRCTIRVLRNKKEFVAVTGNRFGDGYTSGECVWTYHGASGILDNVIPHELAHVMLNRDFGGIPRWLDEGLAVRQEAAAGAYWQTLRDGKRASIGELLSGDFKPATKEDNDRFYASAYSLVDMLIQDGGAKKLRRLIAALKDVSAEQAFRRVYGIGSLRELEDKWATYLQE